MSSLIFSNIIDVSALDTHLLEQNEYNDRVKLYAQRLAHQWNNIQVNEARYNGEEQKAFHCFFITFCFFRFAERCSQSRNLSWFYPKQRRDINGWLNYAVHSIETIINYILD